MKNAFKILFSSFLLLCSCQSGSGTKTLIPYTEEPGYSVRTHYSIGTLHFREEKVEEEFGLLPPYPFVYEKSYPAVSFYNGKGEKIGQFSWEEGEKVLFGWGGTDTPYRECPVREIWKDTEESEKKITPFLTHQGVIQKEEAKIYSSQSEDGYSYTFSSQDAYCLSSTYRQVSFHPSKTYQAIPSRNLKAENDLVFLQEK